jgi:subtilisin-like proprotein convertase family protein
MNHFRTFRCAVLLGLAALSPASGQVVTLTTTVNQTVPDGSLSGLASSVNFSSAATALADLTVSISLSPGPGGGFAGDLYATLVHGGESIVLLNRPGRNTDRRSGYGDGVDLNVTFSLAASDDIHRYREVLNGSPAVPLNSPLTGVWQPDGRTASPLSVVNASARNPDLSLFDGTAPGGLWTLFIADVSNGGIYQLNEWSIEFTALTPVPEPAATAVVFAAVAVAAGFWSRRSRR